MIQGGPAISLHNQRIWARKKGTVHLKNIGPSPARWMQIVDVLRSR